MSNHNIQKQIEDRKRQIQYEQALANEAKQFEAAVATEDLSTRYTTAIHIRRDCLDGQAPQNAQELWDAFRVLRGIQIPVTSCSPEFDAPFRAVHDMFFDRYEAGLWVAPRGGSKCLSVETLIPTLNGWKKMGELKVGDVVFDENGNRCNVLSVTPWLYDHVCYDVVFSDGSIITADEDHLWLTHDRKYVEAVRGKRREAGIARRYSKPTAQKPYPQPRKFTTGQIKDTLRYGLNPRCTDYNHGVPTCGAVQYQPKNLIIDPYLFGCWLGDGGKSGLTITSDDQEIINAFAMGGYAPSWKDRYDYGLLHFHGKIRKLGCLNNKHIPDQYLQGSVNQRIALLQGLMDTDGHVDKKGGKQIFTNTNRAIIDGIVEVLHSLGVKTATVERTAKLYGKEYGPYWQVYFAAKFPVFRLDRKLKFQNLNTFKSPGNKRMIVEVRPRESVPVCCILVDSESHLFLASESFIPTHNTAYASDVTYMKNRWRPNYQAVHVASLKAQSEIAQGYLADYYEDEALKEYFVKAPGKTSAKWKGNSTWKVVTGSRKGVSGHHPSSLTLDELEFWDMDAVEQSYGVPIEKNGYPRMWTGFSTRQRHSGVMNLLTQQAMKDKTFKLYQWSCFEVMQKCRTCIAIDAHPNYRGEKTDRERQKVCGLWNDCKGKLGVLSTGWMKREFLEGQKSRMSEEAWRTQYLCKKPSSFGLVYYNFESAYSHPGNLNNGNFAPWTYNPEIPYYVFHDPAEANKAVLIFVQFCAGRMFIFDEFINPECASTSVSKNDLIEYMSIKGYPMPECVIIDPRRPDAVADFRSSDIGGLAFHVEKPRIDIDEMARIEIGLDLVRGYVCNGYKQRFIFVNDETCPGIVDMFENHPYKFTSKGELVSTAKPSNTLKDESDALRYGTIWASQQGHLPNLKGGVLLVG